MEKQIEEMKGNTPSTSKADVENTGADVSSESDGNTQERKTPAEKQKGVVEPKRKTKLKKQGLEMTEIKEQKLRRMRVVTPAIRHQKEAQRTPKWTRDYPGFCFTTIFRTKQLVAVHSFTSWNGTGTFHCLYHSISVFNKYNSTS